MNFSVIIPSRNASNLVPCVRAIREAGETCRIIVVDDGVDYGTPVDWEGNLEWTDGVDPFIFARNINIGIAAAGTDNVLLLNDDALLKTLFGFTKLHEIAKQHPQYGVISSACSNVGNPNQWPKIGDGLRDEPRMACFVAVLIPRKTIETVGLLDERFTAYGYEDDDYCLRARRAGLKIGVYDGCYVDHGSLTSTFRGDPRKGGNLTTGEAIFRDKWGAGNHAL